MDWYGDAIHLSLLNDFNVHQFLHGLLLREVVKNQTISEVPFNIVICTPEIGCEVFSVFLSSFFFFFLIQLYNDIMTTDGLQKSEIKLLCSS